MSVEAETVLYVGTADWGCWRLTSPVNPSNRLVFTADSIHDAVDQIERYFDRSEISVEVISYPFSDVVIVKAGA